MAKAKVEKETRKLMEAVNDLVKRKGDRYKFKSKNKKMVKKVRRGCIHWIYRKGKAVPTVRHDPDPNKSGNWKCMICGASFPIKPLTRDDYRNNIELSEELVNQILFWAVRLGGDADDMKMFLALRRNLREFGKASKAILKKVSERDQYEKNREKSSIMDQFNVYSGFNYRG